MCSSDLLAGRAAAHPSLGEEHRLGGAVGDVAEGPLAVGVVPGPDVGGEVVGTPEDLEVAAVAAEGDVDRVLPHPVGGEAVAEHRPVRAGVVGGDEGRDRDAHRRLGGVDLAQAAPLPVADAARQRSQIDSDAEFKRLYLASSAKDVAGKAIGNWGIPAIVIIVIIGVGASVFLDEGKIAAVMGLLGGALTAMISMLNGIAGATPKQEKPEFEIMKQLIERLDRLADKEPMTVNVDGDKVIVRKGDNETTMKKG